MGFVQFVFAHQNFGKLSARGCVCMWIGSEEAALKFFGLLPARKIHIEFHERFERRQIFGIERQNSLERQARFFIVAETPVGFGPARGGFEGIGLNGQSGIEGAQSRLKIGLGERGAPADRGDASGYWTIVEGAQEAIRSVRVLLIDRGHGGGSESGVARVRRKILGQGISLLAENRVAVLVLQAVNEQGSRGVIFEQRLIVRIELRPGREFSQTRVIEQVEAKQSRRDRKSTRLNSSHS